MNRANGAKTVITGGSGAGAMAHERVRGQPCEADSLLPPLHGFQRWNSSVHSCGLLFLSQERRKSKALGITEAGGRREEGPHS